MRELKLKKCSNCGALIEIIEDCNCKCNFICCGKEMDDIVSNSKDASFEKHVPTYERKGNKIEVKVNHVMDKEHYIEWICFVTDNKKETVYFKPDDEAMVTFNYEPGTLYAYCNKHGLWESEVR